MTNSIEVILQAAGLRSTQPRKIIFETLRVSGAPMTIGDLVAACPVIDKTSVYRTITTFVDLGVVVRLPRGWKYSYELAAPFRPHHHHLVCDVCGQACELQSERLEQIIAELAREHDFKASGHHFEVTGTCRQCGAINR